MLKHSTFDLGSVSDINLGSYGLSCSFTVHHVIVLSVSEQVCGMETRATLLPDWPHQMWSFRWLKVWWVPGIIEGYVLDWYVTIMCYEGSRTINRQALTGPFRRMRRVTRHRTCGNLGSIANVSPPFEQMQMQKNFAPKLRTSEIVGNGSAPQLVICYRCWTSLERLCCMLHERIVTNSSGCIITENRITRYGNTYITRLAKSVFPLYAYILAYIACIRFLINKHVYLSDNFI